MINTPFWIEEGNEIKAYVRDYATKVVQAPDHLEDKREEIIYRSFDQGMVLAYRSLGQNQYLVIACEEAMLDEVYDNLPKSKEITVVPYGLALLAFLRSKDIHRDGMTVFLEYIEHGCWVTIFDDHVFNAPRWIEGVDHKIIEQDVHRTIRHYLSSTTHENLKEPQIISNKDLGVKDGALEGLALGVFDIHLEHPKRIKNRERHKAFIGRIKMGVMIATSLVLLICPILWVISRQMIIDKQISQKENDIHLVSEDLFRQTPKKYLSRVKEQLTPDFVNIINQALAFRSQGQEFWQIEMNRLDEGVWNIFLIFRLGKDIARINSAFQPAKGNLLEHKWVVDNGEHFLKIRYQIKNGDQDE